MNKDKNEYFEKTMLEELITNVLSGCKRFIGWLDAGYVIIVALIVVALAMVILTSMFVPSNAKQKQSALDTYYDCRNVQELSEEACLLLVLDID